MTRKLTQLKNSFESELSGIIRNSSIKTNVNNTKLENNMDYLCIEYTSYNNNKGKISRFKRDFEKEHDVVIGQTDFERFDGFVTIYYCIKE